MNYICMSALYYKSLYFTRVLSLYFDFIFKSVFDLYTDFTQFSILRLKKTTLQGLVLK